MTPCITWNVFVFKWTIQEMIVPWLLFQLFDISFLRDLNTKNVLVRSDLSCCICNFEKSVAVCGVNAAGLSSPASAAGEPVGTPRYLAPEALNKHTLDPALVCSPKQVDVYALGLLFWEVSRRCRDLYQVGLCTSFFESFFLYCIGETWFHIKQTLNFSENSRHLLSV